jgi:hypothetical protein
MYAHPLNPDSFCTNIQNEEQEKDNKNVALAGRYLRDKLIPDFITKLESL